MATIKERTDPDTGEVWPKLKRDWNGRLVRLKHEMRTNGGTVFPVGHVMRVEFHGRKVDLVSATVSKHGPRHKHCVAQGSGVFGFRDVTLLPAGHPAPPLPFVSDWRREPPDREGLWAFVPDEDWKHFELLEAFRHHGEIIVGDRFGSAFDVVSQDGERSGWWCGPMELPKPCAKCGDPPSMSVTSCRACGEPLCASCECDSGCGDDSVIESEG